MNPVHMRKVHEAVANFVYLLINIKQVLPIYYLIVQN